MKTKTQIKKQIESIKKDIKKFEQKIILATMPEQEEKYTLLYANAMGYVSALEWVLKESED